MKPNNDKSKHKNSKTKYLIRSLPFLTIITLLILIVLASTFLLQTMKKQNFGVFSPDSLEGYIRTLDENYSSQHHPFIEGKYKVNPRDVKEYKMTLLEPMRSSLNTAIPSTNSSFSFVNNSTRQFSFQPHNWSKEELTDLRIPNSGFEMDENNNSWPDTWFGQGNVIYSTENCYHGERCLYVDVDDSPTGYVTLTSAPVDVQELHNYTVSFDISCVECNNESAYVAVIWFRNMSYAGKPYTITERGRYIMYLNNTLGYQTFTLDVEAQPASIKAIFALLVHTQFANVQPRTRLYLDGTG